MLHTYCFKKKDRDDVFIALEGSCIDHAWTKLFDTVKTLSTGFDFNYDLVSISKIPVKEFNFTPSANCKVKRYDNKFVKLLEF